jgi:hypothetical protein
MNVSGSSECGRCPVCQARFRRETVCSRCGADLMPLMLLLTHAYCLRQAARQALQAGDDQAALAAAEAAQNLHATPQGDLLRTVCAAAAQAMQSSSPV